MGDEVAYELARCLLCHSEVFGQVRRGRPVPAKTGEREAVNGSDIVEASLGESFLDTVYQLAGHPQHRRRCTPTALGHASS